MDQIIKKVKVQTESKIQISASDAKVIINLTNPQGELLAQELQVPINTTKEQLQGMLNTLIQEQRQTKKQGKRSDQVEEENFEDENLVFSFFHQTLELTSNLQELIERLGNFSSERRLDITYHPQSLFMIKPLTRQTVALEGHTEPILQVQFRNQGDVAVSCSGDTSIRVWDVATETPLQTLEGGHTNWVLCVSWSPNGQYIASGGMDGMVCIWDYTNNRIIGRPLKGHTKWITSLAWEPLHLNNECTLLASSSKDGTVRLWSRNNNICLITIVASQKCVTKMLFGGNGVIYTASEDTLISVWGKNGHKISDFKGHAHWVNTLALHTDFALRTGCFSEEQVNKGIEFKTPEEMEKAALEKYQKLLAGKSERLVSGSDDQTLCLWQYPKTKPIARMTGHQQPINHVQFSPDGRFIVSASFDKSLRVWDGYNGGFICTFRGHVSPVYQVAWSSDSRMLLSASKDSTLKLWSLSKQKLIFDLPGHSDEVYAVDWSPIGGEKAISGGKDKLVKIWRN